MLNMVSPLVYFNAGGPSHPIRVPWKNEKKSLTAFDEFYIALLIIASC